MKHLITTVTPVDEVLAHGKTDCTDCTHCCEYGSGYMLPQDISRLARHLQLTEAELKEQYLEEIERFGKKMQRPKLLKNGKPYGPCIFLQKGKGCTIEKVKPLYCQVGTCKPVGEEIVQWFTMNYVTTPENPEWAIAAKCFKTIPGAEPKEVEK